MWIQDDRGRLAKSLLTLYNQVNARWPNRLTISDGTIGNLEHQARDSDHNLDNGIVKALDITHDPAHGLDTWALADILRQNKDPRIKYVISNGRIFSSQVSPWQWRKYTGTNSHSRHIHVSVMEDQRQFDSTAPWALDGGATTIRPAPPVPVGITAAMRQRMMEAILAYEGRFADGKINVFVNPGGGREIAGITEISHPVEFPALKRLHDLEMWDNLKSEVLRFYTNYTQPAADWTTSAGVEFMLRDTILHRGPSGAAKILQRAVDTEIDGEVGPATRSKLASMDPDVAVDAIRRAREEYEVEVYTREAREAKGQWQGLVNRWNKAAAQAKVFQKEQGKPGIPPGAGAAATVVVVSGAVAAAVKNDAWTGNEISMAAFSIGVAAIVVFLIVRRMRKRS